MSPRSLIRWFKITSRKSRPIKAKPTWFARAQIQIYHRACGQCCPSPLGWLESGSHKEKWPYVSRAMSISKFLNGSGLDASNKEYLPSAIATYDPENRAGRSCSIQQKPHFLLVQPQCSILLNYQKFFEYLGLQPTVHKFRQKYPKTACIEWWFASHQFQSHNSFRFLFLIWSA